MNVEMWHRVRKHGVRGFKHGACGYYYRDNFTCEDFYGDIINKYRVPLKIVQGVFFSLDSVRGL